jgi:hypothetical protein
MATRFPTASRSAATDKQHQRSMTMNVKRSFFLSLYISTLLLGAASESRAQWGNPTFMQHRVGSQARRNLYHALKVQGLQIRQQEELARADLARAKSMIKFESRYTTLKLPGSSWQSANAAASSLVGVDRTQSAAVPQSTLGLTRRDVDAMREHYEALSQFHMLRREQYDRRNPQKQVAGASPFQLDRTTGSMVWPALLRDDSRFSEDVQRVNQSLVTWTQDGCDPTSLAAIRVRKTIEKMARDLLVMRAAGLIDQTAYNVACTFLQRSAYETQCAGNEGARDVTADLARAR